MNKKLFLRLLKIHIKWLLLWLVVIVVVAVQSNKNKQVKVWSNVFIDTMPIKTTQYVLLSTSYVTGKDFYAIYLPMVVHAWRRLNFEPILIVVYPQNSPRKYYASNSTFAKVIRYLKKLQVKIVYMEAVDSYQVVISQCSRLFAGVLPEDIVKDDDFVIISDADLVPVSESYFRTSHQREGITVWNSKCCGTFDYQNRVYRMYPMGYIGMSKRTWRQVMELNHAEYRLDGKSIVKKLFEIYGQDFKQAKDKSEQIWYADQMAITILINKYAERNQSALYLRRLTGERMERILSRSELERLLRNPDWITDAHLFQEDLVETDYKKGLFREFFFTFFSDSQSLNEFYSNYFKD